MLQNQIFIVFENCTISGDWEDVPPASGLAVIMKDANDDKNSIISVLPIEEPDRYFRFQKGARINISGNVLMYHKDDATPISYDEYLKRYKLINEMMN